nr:unnamed protein product [Callosobruchus chinensis]
MVLLPGDTWRKATREDCKPSTTSQ